MCTVGFRGSRSSWRPVNSRVPQRSILGTVLFNTFISYLGDGARHTLSKLAEGKKLVGVADTPDGCAAIRGDLSRLKKQADRNLIKYNNGNGQVVHQQEITLHQYMLRANHLESSVSWQI